MTFHIHRAERADRLARELGEILRQPLPDAFSTEVVAVPTQGVERWLAQTLSHQLGTSSAGRDGVCGGVDFPSPRRLTAAALAAMSGIDAAADPWLPRRAVWPLLGVIDRARGEQWAVLLWSSLAGSEGPAICGVEAGRVDADPVRRGRRWSTAQHLAELFAHYDSARPQMLLAWLQGHDVDGSGQPLPSDYAWQAELWRRLRAELGTPSPAERTEGACRRLVSDPGLSDLPARLSVFGATRLSLEHRAVLSALAVHRDVHLWLPHPSATLWDHVAARLNGSSVAGPRAADPTADLPANPLLGYLGRDSRELQLTVATTKGTVVDHYHPSEGPSAGWTPTLLQRLQSSLARDAAVLAEEDRPLLDPTDRSVTVHASHGPGREVEVLRDLLVGLLADDPTLEPRDIVVMCPDIEKFAPLISASFGLAGDDHTVEHPGHQLRVRLADRALRQVNPLLATLSRVLGLADSRLEASSLLDLCAFEPVARKFGFSEDELERLRDLVQRSGVRWGLDAEQRRDFAMGQFGQNTWTAGLDRLLLGVTLDESEQQYIGTALPLDDVDSSDVDLVGRLAEFVDRIRRLLLQFSSARPLASWVDLCRQTIELLTTPAAAEEWQLAHAYAQLGSLADVSGEQPQAELSVADVRALLADTFRGRATRANFRTGTLTMCTLMPMRSVPHRVLCLLGLDDGVFPRHNSRDGDDILAVEPWVGDRDPRSEDRQLLLDAILAAQERLVVIYSGVDARTRASKPPAVPIGALLDALDITARREDGGRVRDQVVTVHRLQPFDPANFVPGGLTGPGSPSFSFDHGALRAAAAASRPRTEATSRFDTSPLQPVALPQVIALPDLVRFFSHPLRALLKARAGLNSFGSREEPSEQIPMQLTSLDAWAVGDRLLKLHLDGTGLDQLTAAEWRRGSLPPRAFGSRALAPIVDSVKQIASSSMPFLSDPRRGVDVLAELGSHSVAGTLSSVHGQRLVAVNYSWVGPKHRLQAWIELLALTVSQPDRSWQAVSIGRGRPSLLGPISAEFAERVLADLIDLYRSGLAEPIPLGPKTAAEYARIRYEGKSITVLQDKLEKVWKEERDLAYERFFDAALTFKDLLQLPSVPTEERGDLAEPSRFGTLARRVWHPLLDAEELL